MYHVSRYPDFLNIIKSRDSDPDSRDESLAYAENMAHLAKSEMANDFPLLRSHAVMGLWGALEAMVEDTAISWMEHNPAALAAPKIAKIRVPFAEFQRLDQQDRLRFLIMELQRDLGTELKSGATKFESLLDVVGLGGRVDRRVKNTLFETQNLRNVIAHRGGIADQRLVANCPHLQYSVGDPIRINEESFDRISDGLLTYAVTILNRCRVITGLQPISIAPSGYEGALSLLGEDDDI
jgi:hypothetical protein